MCGRFSLTVGLEEVAQHFKVEKVERLEERPRYNIAPTQEVPVIVSEAGKRRVVTMRWGLIPHWSKDTSFASRMINARGETVAQKPAFRKLFQCQRCLIPADGYYEWKNEQGSKQPYRIVKKNRGLMAFAGLWDRWFSPQGGAIDSFTIITIEACRKIAHLHHRMPVILGRGVESTWLDNSIRDSVYLGELLYAGSSDDLEAYSVSTVVNAAKNDVPECIMPME